MAIDATVGNGGGVERCAGGGNDAMTRCMMWRCVVWRVCDATGANEALFG
jgi:hypothetical protein